VGAVVIDGRINMGENFEGQYKKNIDKTNFKIVRSTYLDRLRALMEEGDAYVIFNGGTGTISEIGEVWAEAKFNFGNHKPIIFVGEFWRDILEPIANYMKIDNQETSVYEIVDTPEEVYEVLRKIDLEQ
jgi:predicted Rossmann-fold nucleotide-binding protein